MERWGYLAPATKTACYASGLRPTSRSRTATPTCAPAAQLAGELRALGRYAPCRACLHKLPSLPGVFQRPAAPSFGGAPAGLRPPLSGPLRGRARRFAGSPRPALRTCARGRWPDLQVPANHLARPLRRRERRALPPPSFWPAWSTSWPWLAGQNSAAPPPAARWTGAAPHFTGPGRLSASLPACVQAR